MSIDLNLLLDRYIEISEIERIIFELNFKELEEVNNTYFWFEPNYVSTRGCYLSVRFDLDVCLGEKEDDIKIFQTVITTSTNAGRSYRDLDMQIELIKRFQFLLGGEIFDPAESKFQLFDNFLPNLTTTEIACGLEYVHFERNLYLAKNLIEEIDSEMVNNMTQLGLQPIDKGLLRNNTLLPFFVAVLETFLKQFFKAYLETNNEALDKIFMKKDKISYSLVKELVLGEKSIVDLEVKEYSFQNFNSANRGYQNYLGFDLFSVLSKTIEFNNDKIVLASVLQEMINYRHEIIHEAVTQTHLDKETMDKYYYSIEKFGEIFINDFMDKRSLRLMIEEEL